MFYASDDDRPYLGWGYFEGVAENVLQSLRRMGCLPHHKWGKHPIRDGVLVRCQMAGDDVRCCRRHNRNLNIQARRYAIMSQAEKRDEIRQESWSRRQFLHTAGSFAAGTVVGAGALGLTSCTAPVPLQIQMQPPAACPPCPQEQQATSALPEWPWPYVALDPEIVRIKAHQGYYQAGCSYGAFAAILSELQEKIGFPYTHFPMEMMRYGEGGVAGWATLCGAINGASAAINLVAGEEYHDLVDELVGWYTVFPFPSDQSNQYAEEGLFLVAGKPSQPLVQNVAGSPLCHVSVTEWCLESGYPSKSPERSERCGRLTGDVAAHAVELLNQHAEGSFIPVFEFSSSTAKCTGCHFNGSDFEAGQFTRGKMECTGCHEPHR
jgi:hypothetical protein